MSINFIKSGLSFLPSLALMAAGLFTISITQLKPPQSGTVIAIFHPQMSDNDVIISLKTNDFLMAKGPTAHSYIIRGEDINLPQRLKSNGAWLVLNYLGAAGCSSAPALQSNIFSPHNVT